MVDSGTVEFFPNTEYVGDRTVVSRVSGRRYEVPERCRIVDARYLAPGIPVETPPPFRVGEDARVIPVNDLVRLEEAPSQFVIVGSGKTATDACIWLLSRGVDPDAICWVRPRDPWMMNRAVVQPDPAIFLGMVADTMQAAEDATSLDDLFLRLEDAGIMLRIDRTVTPTMAKAPTLGDVGARAAAHHRERRSARSPRGGGPGPAHLRRRFGRRRGRRRHRALRRGRPEVPAAGSGLAPRGDHPAADQGRVPLLRCRTGGVRRGDPRGRPARRTGSVRRRRTATRWRSGRG